MNKENKSLEKLKLGTKEKEIKNRRENKKKDRKNNKIHDSIIKEILDDKEEFKDYMEKFHNVKIEEEKLELQNKEYRTRFGLRSKYIDVLYKIQGEETFIIVEHQSTVDYVMSERMGDYCLAVVGSRRRYMVRSKNRIAPLVYPMVLSTAKKPWDATRTIKQDEGNLYKLPVQKYPEYEVTDINDYKVEFLINLRTGLGIILAFEKIKTKEDYIYIMESLKNRKINKRERRAMELIIEHLEEEIPILKNKLTEEEIEELKEELLKIIMKEGDFIMMNFTKAFVKIIEEEGKKVRKEEIKEARKEGRKEGKKFGENIIKSLFKSKMSAKEIAERTGIALSEILKIVKN